jgi:UDP-glucose 4-epimerase
MAAPPKRVAWVTGATGFIGTHVRRQFMDEGWSVVSIDPRRANRPDSLTLTAEIDGHSLGAAYDMAGPPQAVFHGAGTGAVAQSIANPRACHRDTVDSTKRLLNFLSRDAPRCRVVLASSAAVYGAAEEAPLSEDRALAPVSPYGEHKRAAEDLCRAAAASGLPTVALRMFSVYGPGLRKQLPWELGRRLLTSDDAIELFGTGQETRDFLAVEDAARFIVALAATPHPTPLVVNGGTGTATTVADFAGSLAAALGVTREIRFNGRSRAGDPQHYRADVSRLNGLGLNPQTSLHDGLAAYAAWLKSVPAKT